MVLQNTGEKAHNARRSTLDTREQRLSAWETGNMYMKTYSNNKSKNDKIVETIPDFSVIRILKNLVF